MSRFVDIDLSSQPKPDVVEALDYETIKAQVIADAVERLALAGIPYNVAALESDPVVKVLEVCAYRELLLRQRVNDAARAVMLAYAYGTDLDNRADYFGVKREIVTPADPANGKAEVREADDRFRERIQLAPEAFAAAGPEGAYQFHTFGVDTSIVDVAVLNPVPGHIHVLPLVSAGDGLPSSDLLERVRARLKEPKIKPLTDILTVRAPAPVSYAINANVRIGAGPDRTLVVARARANVAAYAASRRRIGYDVPLSGIIAALHVAGVDSVDLLEPLASVVSSGDAVAIVSAITVSTT